MFNKKTSVKGNPLADVFLCAYLTDILYISIKKQEE